MVDLDQVVRDAQAKIRELYPTAEYYGGYRSRANSTDDYRPGHWFIAARLTAHTALGIHTHLVCVNMETGERRLKDGWYPGQPIELADEKPDWLMELPPLAPLAEHLRHLERS